MELIKIILNENHRIKDKIKELDEKDIIIYMEAYKDAMIYVEKLDKYKRIHGKNFWSEIK